MGRDMITGALDDIRDARNMVESLTWSELDRSYPEHGKLARAREVHGVVQRFLSFLDGEEVRLVDGGSGDEILDTLLRDELALRFVGVDQDAYLAEHRAAAAAWRGEQQDD